MTEVLNIDDWLKTSCNKQFEIYKNSEIASYTRANKIINVRRIKDSRLYCCGNFVYFNDVAYALRYFDEDCIHVYLWDHDVYSDLKRVEINKLDINDLLFKTC